MNGLKASRAICFCLFFFETVAYPFLAEPEGIHLAQVIIATAFVGWAIFDLAIFFELKDKKK